MTHTSLQKAKLDKDGDVELSTELTLKGPLSATLLKHAEKRKVRPIDLLADLLDVILGEDLVDAVLDDRVTPA